MQNKTCKVVFKVCNFSLFSITDWWAWHGQPIFNRYYAPLGVANYGIAGDQTQHVLWRIQNGEVSGLNPRLVVLKIGTNNLGKIKSEKNCS